MDSNYDLSATEIALGILTAAVAYFMPPLALVTGAIFVGVIYYRINPQSLPSVASRLLPGHSGRRGAQQLPDPTPEAPQNGTQSLLELLEDQLHLLVIGHTRGGKTSLIHELATRQAGQGMRVLVCDPDAAPGLWPGCRVVGHGDNWEAIAAGLSLVRAEVKKRRKQRSEGVRRFNSLGVVIDEYQDIASNVDGATELVEDIARRGGKLGIRLTLGVQDKQVKTLRLDGKGDLRNNFTTVEVMRKDGQRLAAIAGQNYPIPTLPNLDNLIHQQPVPAPLPAADQATLGALLAGSEGGSEGGTGSGGVVPAGSTAVEAGSEGGSEGGTGSGGVVPAGSTAENERITLMLQAGMTGNQICDVLGGNRKALLAKIKEIRGA